MNAFLTVPHTAPPLQFDARILFGYFIPNILGTSVEVADTKFNFSYQIEFLLQSFEAKSSQNSAALSDKPVDCSKSDGTEGKIA